MAHEPAVGDQAVAVIAGAVARTQAAAGARIKLQIGQRPLPQFDRSIRAKLNPMCSVARWVVRIASAPNLEEGVIDLHNHRYMVFGVYAQVIHADGTSWGGSPGQPLSRWRRSRGTTAVALWLWGLLEVITGAHEQGQEDVRDASCRRFAIDFNPSTLPPLWRANPDASQPAVWIGEDGYVRRVTVHAQQRTLQIELWDFGAHTIDLDWTRLPSQQPVEDT